MCRLYMLDNEPILFLSSRTSKYYLNEQGIDVHEFGSGDRKKGQ